MDLKVGTGGLASWVFPQCSKNITLNQTRGKYAKVMRYNEKKKKNYVKFHRFCDAGSQ